MTTQSPSGWDSSAAAWITSLGESGDFGRRYVLDAPMLALATAHGHKTALDIGCGEGRFCRMLKAHGLSSLGIDPTRALIERARSLDRSGSYKIARAEEIEVPDGSFDLAVCYLSLIDIPDLAQAVEKIVAALRPGGSLLIANLTSFNTAGGTTGWSRGLDGRMRFSIDHYMAETPNWASWRGIRVQNWHRPLSTYMTLFLQHGLELRHFSEPLPTGGDPSQRERYCRVPWFHIMEWRKPA